MNAVLNTTELVVLIIGLLLVAAAVFGLSKRLRLPFTVLLVVAGMVLASLARYGPEELRFAADFELSPDVILLVFIPTLVFEAAFNLDPRQLRHNLLPILALAVPGLLLSTGLIGVIVWGLTPFDLASSLLLGAILSATDPVAVMSVFRKLGVPKRLATLVEGESLFNDATAIVASQILLGIALTGHVAWSTVWEGGAEFLLVFVGGMFIGWLAALLAGEILERVDNEPFVEISLIIVLAYLSFLVAEKVFHVSGVMATVTAAITMGTWGKTKISPPVRGYLGHFWGYLSDMANALVFLLVGMQVDLLELLGSWDLLLVVIAASLISRALLVFSLMPLLGEIPGVGRVDGRYRMIMFWGGLRGAIALALALSLEGFVLADTFVALVTGVVLFTLLVPGLTIERLTQRLGLDGMPLADRLALNESLLLARDKAARSIAKLQNGGLFSANVAHRLEDRARHEVDQSLADLEELREQELDPEAEQRLVLEKSLAIEKAFYFEMFEQGYLSEPAYRNLVHSIDIQVDALRLHRRLPERTLFPPWRAHWEVLKNRFMVYVLRLPSLAERNNARGTAQAYELARGRFQSGSFVLDRLRKLARRDPRREAVIDKVGAYYREWRDASQRRLDRFAEDYPEFIANMQEQLAERMLIHTQRGVVDKQWQSGAISDVVARKLHAELDEQLRRSTRPDVDKLSLSRDDLLRRVPLFSALPEEALLPIREALVPRSVPQGRVLLDEDSSADSLFLLARGVARLSIRELGADTDLATLVAGDYFGEMALLGLAPQRQVSCVTVSDCLLYELGREDFRQLAILSDAIQESIRQARGRERPQAR